MALKIVVLAPMPRANVKTTMTVKLGRLSSIRKAKRMSWSVFTTSVFYPQITPILYINLCDLWITILDSGRVYDSLATIRIKLKIVTPALPYSPRSLATQLKYSPEARDKFSPSNKFRVPVAVVAGHCAGCGSTGSSCSGLPPFPTRSLRRS